METQPSPVDQAKPMEPNRYADVNHPVSQQDGTQEIAQQNDTDQICAGLEALSVSMEVSISQDRISVSRSSLLNYLYSTEL